MSTKRWVFTGVVVLVGTLAFLLLPDHEARRLNEAEPSEQVANAHVDFEDAAESDGARRTVPGPDGALEDGPAGALDGAAVTSDLVVRVVSRLDTRVPIAGARVEFRDGSLSGTTDKVGLCALRPTGSIASATRLIVSAAGYATREVAWSADAERAEFTVALSSEGSISGTVKCVSDRTVEGSVMVFAWRSDRNFTSEEVVSAWSGRPSWNVHVTRTDETGRFRLGGLDPEQRYRLLGVGRGYWGMDSSGPIVPGPEDIVCRVQTAFAVVVQISSADERPLAVDSRLFAGRSGWSAAPDGTEPWSPIGPELALLRAAYGSSVLEGVSVGEATNWRASLLLYLRADGSTHPVGPVDFEVEPPGCEPIRASINVPWLGSGELTRIQLQAKCTDCTGSLAFEPPLEDVAGWSAPSRIVMTEVGTGMTMQAVVDPFDSERFRLGGLPCGAYDVRISSEHTMFTWPARGSPPIVVNIQRDRTSSLYIKPWSRLGRVEIDLVDQYGELYRDAASFEIEYEHRGQWLAGNAVRADHAPYRCALLPAEDWAVCVRIADVTYRSLEPRTPFTVLPGRTTRVVVAIRR